MVSTLAEKRKHKHKNELFGEVNFFIRNVYKKLCRTPRLLQNFLSNHNGKRKNLVYPPEKNKHQIASFYTQRPK